MALLSQIQRTAHRKLAGWIALTHPELFNQLATLAIQQQSPTRAQVAGLGDLTMQDFTFDPGTIAMPDMSSLDNVWSAGGVPGLDSLVVDPNTLSDPYSGMSAGNTAAGTSLSDAISAGFTDFTFDPSLLTAPSGNFNPADLTGGAASPDSSGGFFSGIGKAVSSVGDFLTSKPGLTALTGLATAVLTTQAQGQVLQAQVQRAQAGASPAPIQYVRNASGQLVPAVVDPRTGQLVPVTGNALQQYATAGSVLPQGLAQWLPALLLGGGVLFLISMALRARAGRT